MADVNESNAIQLFENQKIRTAWDAEKEEWYFSIIDVISVLADTASPRRYWSDLKRELKSEGAVEVYENIVQLKLLAPDGKKRKTDVANTEHLLRIIQSIPSPKAEPFKAWLAMVGKERIEETFEENRQIAKRGGKVTGIARQALEAETGKTVITEKMHLTFSSLSQTL